MAQGQKRLQPTELQDSQQRHHEHEPGTSEALTLAQAELRALADDGFEPDELDCLLAEVEE